MLINKLKKKVEDYNGPLITVCDKCLQASCWQGIFMCWESQSAGIIELPRELLEEIGLENEGYWDPEG